MLPIRRSDDKFKFRESNDWRDRELINLTWLLVIRRITNGRSPSLRIWTPRSNPLLQCILKFIFISKHAYCLILFSASRHNKIFSLKRAKGLNSRIITNCETWKRLIFVIPPFPCQPLLLQLIFISLGDPKIGNSLFVFNNEILLLHPLLSHWDFSYRS